MAELSTAEQPSAAFTELAALIPAHNKLRFSSAARLAGQMEVKIRQCEESRTGCYVHISGVSEQMLDHIDNAFTNLGIRRQVRFTYEHALESMVIRCMPGAAHGITSRSFMMELAVKISSIPGHQKHSSFLLGRSRFSVPGKRSKEGDEGIKPTATRRSRDDWPSLVVEVGYPQSLPSLRADARWWLDHSGERTNMVIVIQIKDLGPKSIYLECWERLPDPSKGSTRSHTKKIPDFEQYFDIDASGTVVSHHPSHPDLVIPYKAMFDNPHPTGTDIIISKAELSQWVLHVFGGLH